MATYTILKPFRAGGNFYNPTDNPVDGEVFKNVDQLVDQRYISPTEAVSPGHSGSTPDPKLVQNAAVEAAAGRESDVGAEGADPAKKARLGSVGAALDAAGDLGGDEGTSKGDGQTSDDESAEAQPTGDADPLPEGFPGKAKLEAAGLTTYGDVRGQRENLSEIEGIGPKTAEAINAELDASPAAKAEE
jgi:hypothetical protein